MTTAEEVIEAYHAIGKAEAHYRELLRDAIRDRGNQAAIARALGVTREKLRVDALTEEERQAVREADAKRKAELRQRAKGGVE